MRAMLCRSLGSIDKLELGDVPPPPLTDGHVRIGVKAAGVNFPDILMVQGGYQHKPELPFVVGGEFAGEVSAVGANVERLRESVTGPLRKTVNSEE